MHKSNREIERTRNREQERESERSIIMPCSIGADLDSTSAAVWKVINVYLWAAIQQISPGGPQI